MGNLLLAESTGFLGAFAKLMFSLTGVILARVGVSIGIVCDGILLLLAFTVLVGHMTKRNRTA